MDIDPDAGLVKRVKVLGYESLNRRRYTPEAAQSGLAFYEGARVNLDHAANPHATRGVRDRFGVLSQCTAEADGVWANLRYNPKHSYAEEFRWWAENAPDAIGLSHNAVGQGHDEDGVFVVERILAVRSVDLVADPATTKSLFEGQNQGGPKPVKLKISQLIEHVNAKLKATAKRCIEMGDLDPEMEVEAPVDADAGGEVDHEAALTSGFEQACSAIVRKVLDGSMDAKEGIAKLKEFLNSHGKLSGGGNAPSEPAETEEAVKKHPAYKAMASRLDAIEAANKVAAKKAQAAKVIGEAKLPKEAITDLFVESVESAADEKAMKALVEDRRKLCSIQRPRSAGATTQATTESVSYESFVKNLKKGA